jgi:hypothetical protein
MDLLENCLRQHHLRFADAHEISIVLRNNPNFLREQDFQEFVDSTSGLIKGKITQHAVWEAIQEYRHRLAWQTYRRNAAAASTSTTSSTTSTTISAMNSSNNKRKTVTFKHEEEEDANFWKQRYEEEKKEKEKEKKRADEEKKRADKSFRKVHECIGGIINIPLAPIAETFTPEHGPLPEDWSGNKPSSHSTKSSASWIQVPANQMSAWSFPDLVQFLETGGKIPSSDTDPTPLLDKILDANVPTNIGEHLAGLVPKTTSIDGAGKDETQLTGLLHKLFFGQLEEVVGGKDEEYNKSCGLIAATVTESTTVKNNLMVSVIPPQYQSMYKLDLAAHLRFGPEAIKFKGTVLNFLEEDDTTTRTIMENFQKLTSCVAIELKADYSHPEKWFEATSEKFQKKADAINKISKSGLLCYNKWHRFKPEKFNPISQGATYAAALRTRYFMISTGNRTTYCKLTVDNPAGKLLVQVSPTFPWNQGTIPPIPSRPNWSHWEILVRFLLAAKDSWYIERYPNELKQIFRKKKEAVPEKPIKTNDEQETPKKKDEDDADDDKYDSKTVQKFIDSVNKSFTAHGNTSNSRTTTTTRNSSSNTTKRSNSSANTSSSWTTPVRSSISSTDLTINPVSEKTKSSNARKKAPSTVTPFERIYYEDLWDPIRFAIPSTHPELEGSLQKLPGDAEVLGDGCRTGIAYRKILQGRDVVVKMLPLSPHNFDKDTEVWRLQDELKHEAEVYDYLQRSFQRDGNSKFIPEFLWYGELVPGLADCLVTEYAGMSMAQLAKAERLTVEHGAGAEQALTALHNAGILHGDIELRNFCVDERTGIVRMIDFGFAQFRDGNPNNNNIEADEIYNAEEWENSCKWEHQQLKRVLKDGA